jgi:hypothetical protein
MKVPIAWPIRGGAVDLEPWALMGVVNATPDSFSDGGLHLDPAAAATAAVTMVEAGATKALGRARIGSMPQSRSAGSCR